MPLDHAVDIQHYAQVVVPQHPNVGTPVGVVLQSDDPLDELGIGQSDVAAHRERRPRGVEQTVGVPVTYDGSGGDDPLVYAVVVVPLQTPVQGEGC